MLTDIFCPHCGGQMEIDTTQRLQSMFSCPYCGRKSLMQKSDDSVQLRGIILPGAFGGTDGDAGADGRSAGSDGRGTGPDPRGMAAEPRPAMTETRTLAPEARPAAAPALEPAPAAAIVSAASAAPGGATAAPGPTPAAVVGATATSAVQSAEPPLEQMIRRAQQALASGQMLAFNSYARQAIDLDPVDPRMYILRARLTEEAHGFARATFLSPGWTEQTPRQRGWIMAQHFATLNAAVSCSPEPVHGALANQIGILIARQIRDTFLERARLRLGAKGFRGRYRSGDLHQAPAVIEACLAIDDAVAPKVASRLVLAIREELARIDPTLTRHLQRKGF